MLVADPDAKKSRSGAISEGRELHVANVEFNASEGDIREFFSQYGGTVENIRLIRSAAGKFFGTCFIVFSKPEEASAAVVLNNKPFRGRLLRVSLATDKSTLAKQATTKLIPNPTGSVEPEDKSTDVAESTATNGRRTSVASAGNSANAAAPAISELNEDNALTKRERTVALLNLPDTVNDARIQSHLSAYGPLRKILLKRDREGALVEFVNLQDAGKVGMGIDCSALGPDVRIGTAKEMLLGDRKAKAKGPTSGSSTAAAKASIKPAFGAPPMRPAQASVARPAQRGGRRGGLGLKRGGLGVGASRAKETDAEGDAKMDEGSESGQKKGNAEFRALFEKSRESATGEDKED